MPTTIDTFIVEFGLDTSRFTKGQKDALDALRQTQEESVRYGKDIESSGKKMEAFFGKLKREALAFVGLVFAGKGIKEFVGFITDLDAGTSRLAKTFNMSERELSAWQGAIEQIGGSAGSANSALQGLSSAVNTFMITGEGSFLGVTNQLGISLFNANKNLKTSGELLLEMATALDKWDPARAAAMLAMIPGMNQDMINLLLSGRAAVEQYLDAARKAGGTTRESAEAAKLYQERLTLLERSASSLGRTFVTFVTPALVSFFDRWTKILGEWNRGQIISPDSLLGRMLGLKLPPEVAPPLPSRRNSGEVETYIRQSAASRGINPDVAVEVYRREGAGGYVGDRGSSFGPFQLHYGGVAGGGMAVSGLGDAFTRRTGLDARDPSTWKAQVDFALDEAKRSGWGAWHGWKGLPYEGIGPSGAGAGAAAGVVNNAFGARTSSSSTATTTIGKIEIHTQAKDAAEIARDIRPALERGSFAGSANYGLR